MGLAALGIDLSLADKYERLLKTIREFSFVGVAFSGGTDSSFLLQAAVIAIGPESVTAYFADSTLLTSDEKKNIHEIPKILGCKLHVQKVDPLLWPEFVANPSDRCYHCKKKIYSLFLKDQKSRSHELLLDGTNTDDLLEDRPGTRAARELGVRAPLLEVGFSKREIRLVSRTLGLPTWDAISSSCLATRIPSGSLITAQKLMLVEKCERELMDFGFLGCRIRLFNSSVHIELRESDMARFVTSNTMFAIRNFIQAQGVAEVFLDLKGRKCGRLEVD